MIKLYGKNCIYEAIKANAPLKEVFILEDNKKNFDKFINLLKDNNIKTTFVKKDFLNKNFREQHQGIAAYRDDYPKYELDYLLTLNKSRKRVLILDGIQDPQNLGAIIRSCDAFQFDAIVLGNNRSVPLTDIVAHVSTGAIEYVPIIYVNSLSNAVRVLKQNNFWIIGTDASGDTLVENIDKNLDLALIIGSEGFGMTRSLVKESDFVCKIPMKGHVNSLNASVSAGILLEKLS